MKLKSISEEAEACRAAFKNSAVGDMVVHCHHEILYEKLSEPAEKRIAYILKEKHAEEQALRLRLFRPVQGQARAEYENVQGQALAEYRKVEGQALEEYENVQGPAWAEYEKVKGPAFAEYRKVEGQAWAEYKKVEGQAHKLICVKGCPWDGNTIFAN